LAPPSFTFVFAVLGRFKHRLICTQRAIRDIKKLEAATRAFVFAFTFHAFTFHHCLTLADDRFGCFNKVEPQEFNVEQVVQFWLTEAEEALHVADHLMEKADYSYALFFDHLAVEKLLKALYAIRLHEHAPPVHNLVRLSRAVWIGLGREATGCFDHDYRFQY